MRPRYLEIEGLQSFKEQQRIDFDKLSETGLFGIFGPTGSGKSTILDAITLALYGSVHRAAKGTQGIINTDMGGTKVAFTFDLTKEGMRRTYRVERQYKRKKDSDSSAEAKLVRLMELANDQEYILADKHSDVNSLVIELVGLKFEDFTRSVVLPQNKFQEFLLSPRGEKTKMLERIFYLEEYGRQLGDKVNKQMAAVKNRLSNIEGALSTLGITSPEALIESERKLVEAQEHKSDCANRMKAAEDSYAKGMQAYKLSKEHEELSKRLQECNGRDAEIKDLMAKLSRSEAANAIKPIIAAYREAEKGFRETDLSLNSLKEQLTTLEDRKSKAQAKYTAAAKQKEESLPELIKYRTMLQECEIMQQELRVLTKQLDTARKEYEEIRIQMEAAKKTATEKTQQKDSLSKEVQELEQKSDSYRVDNEYRKQIGIGLDIEKELQGLELSYKKQSDKYQELQKNLSTYEKSHQTALDSLNKSLEALNKMNEEKSAHEASRPMNREEIAEKQNHIIKLIEQQTQQTQHTAAMLANTLRSGEACPVCGSLHHPNPAVINELEQQKQQDYIASEKERLAKASQEYTVWEQKLQKLNEGIKLQENLSSEAKLQESKLAVQMESTRAAVQQEYDQLEEQKKLCDEKAAKHNQMKDQLKVNSFMEEAKQIALKDEQAHKLADTLKLKRSTLDALNNEVTGLLEKINEISNTLLTKKSEGIKLREQKEEKEKKITGIIGDKQADLELELVKKQIEALESSYKTSMEEMDAAGKALEELQRHRAGLISSLEYFQQKLSVESKKLEEELQNKGFANREDAEACMLTEEKIALSQAEAAKHHREKGSLEDRINSIAKQLQDTFIDEEQWLKLSDEYARTKDELEKSISLQEAAKSHYMQIKASFEKWLKLQEDLKLVSKKKDMLEQIQKLLKGNAFIEFISEERMRYIAREATETLGELTKFRYSIELDSENGFVIRDNANGGVLRSVASLSGGETFLTSLSLALALSSQLQLKGQSPLEFFFLDEGFGTLDNALLDTVIDSLERLSSNKRVIGLISHVPEMKNRITRRLIIDAPDRAGKGSRVSIEKA